MLPQYNYHIWFKVCKPIKGKYKLSTNCLLVLSAAHIYYNLFNKPFTERSLLMFATYYNNVKIGRYIKVLICHNYIIESGLIRGYKVFNISLAGLQVIKELNESYNKELVLFCSKYNIEL